VKFAFISEEKVAFPVAVLCRLLAVSPSGYYTSQCRPVSPHRRRDKDLSVRVTASHLASKRRYGIPRVHADLKAAGQCVGRKRVARLMRENALVARTRRRFRITTNSVMAAVRAISWMDHAYDFGEGRSYIFSGGNYAELDSEGQCNVCMNIRAVTFGDVDGDGQEDALVLVSSNLGGAGTSIYGYMFGLEKGLPVLRATIEGGDRGEGGLESIIVKDGCVVVRRFASGASDSICCPTRIEIERWRWTDGKLVKTGLTRVVRRPPRPWSMSR
jgi:hypothetical protein